MWMIPAGKLEPQQTEAWILSWHLANHPSHQLLSQCLYGPRNWKQAAWKVFSFLVPGFRLKKSTGPGAPSKSICGILQALAAALCFQLFDLERALCGKKWSEKQPLSLSFASHGTRALPYHRLPHSCHCLYIWYTDICRKGTGVAY